LNGAGELLLCQNLDLAGSFPGDSTKEFPDLFQAWPSPGASVGKMGELRHIPRVKLEVHARHSAGIKQAEGKDKAFSAVEREKGLLQMDALLFSPGYHVLVGESVLGKGAFELNIWVVFAINRFA
jgi:hypothetical protein